MPDKAVYLLVVPGFADWEPAHALAELRRHGGYRVEVVVMGEMHVEEGRVLRPGDVMVSEPGMMYGPHIAGPEGVMTVEVNGRIDGRLEFEDPAIQQSYDAFRAQWAKEHATTNSA